MPNHVHLLTNLTGDRISIEIIGRLKKSFSRKALKYLRDHYHDFLHEVFDGKEEEDGQFWQHGRGFWRPAKSKEAVFAMIEYTHNNPVKLELCGRPEEYPWSSARYWLKGDDTLMMMDDP